ncbi:MAG: hypothetical protein KKG47_10535 [Proteobacteria bacterium]|nr:hypothetical protein [Pseudomonadota bacterium]MBU1737586.1 hypothetical protein [Pseudomonadota bacterium]
MKLSAEKICLIKKLFAECPEDRNLPDCPARNIRKLTPENQEKLLARMTAEAIDSILEQHDTCMNQ